MALSLIAWFSLYSRKQRVPWVMDMGWFLFAAWMIVIPYYILKTEDLSMTGADELIRPARP